CGDVLDAPVVVAVHIAVAVKQTGMVWMIRRFARQLAGRKRAVDDLAGGGTQRVQIWSGEVLVGDVDHRDRLAVDLDGDLFRPLCEPDLRQTRYGGAEGK